MKSTSAAAQSARVLGVADVTLFMVTAGCSLQWTATAAATGPSSLAVWVLGALAMFLPLSVCVIFLSSRYADEGGLFSWSSRAFGSFAGFMTGWTYWVGTLTYLPAVMYFTAGSAVLLSAHSSTAGVTPAYFTLFALATLAIAVALNVYGLRVAKWLNNAGAIARWLGTVLLLVLGFASWWRFGPAVPMNRHTLTPTFHMADVIFLSTLAFCFTGPEAASFMGGEIRNPQRTVPRALLLAAPMIVAVYVIGTASILFSIPPERASGVYGVMEAIRGAAAHLGLLWLIPLGAACVVLDRAGSVCLWIGALARVPASAGIEPYLPEKFTRLHPRHASPVTAIWTQASIVALLVVVGQAGTSVRGAYNVLIEMMVVGAMLPFLLLFGAAIRLSRGAPAVGEVRIPGGRGTVVAMGLLGLATTLASITLAFLPPPDEPQPTMAVLKVAGVTAALLLAGAAVYAAGRVRLRRSATARLALLAAGSGRGG